MKRLALLLILVSAPAALAKPVILGTLTSSGASVNNSTTAVPFTIDGTSRMQLALQCDAAAYWLTGSGSSLTVSSSTGFYIAGSTLPYPMGNPDSTVSAVAIVSVSGTVNCKVIWLQGVALEWRAPSRWLARLLPPKPPDQVGWERRYLQHVRRAA